MKDKKEKAGWTMYINFDVLDKLQALKLSY